MMTTRRPCERGRTGTAPRAGRGRSVERPAALAPAEAVAAMAGLLRGPHHLADEGLRTLGAPVAVLDAARAGCAGRRRASSWLHAPRQIGGDGARSIEIAWTFRQKAPAGAVGGDGRKSSIHPTTCARPKAALFSCRPLVGFLCSHLSDTPNRPPQPASTRSSADRAHGCRFPMRHARRTGHRDCGARPVQSCAGRSVDRLRRLRHRMTPRLSLGGLAGRDWKQRRLGPRTARRRRRMTRVVDRTRRRSIGASVAT